MIVLGILAILGIGFICGMLFERASWNGLIRKGEIVKTKKK